MAELPATLGEALAAARGRIPASEARMFLREVTGCTAAQVAASLACCSRTWMAVMRAASTRRAEALFWCWERPSWHSATMPVGRWVMRTAESV